jgi:hypothetical protein
MKSASMKKQQSKSTSTPMTLVTALAFIDFSQSPPVPAVLPESIDPAIGEKAGEKIYEALCEALVQDDTPTVVKCYQALHYCFGLDLEAHRLSIGGGSKIALLMTVSQAAVWFNRVDLTTALFDACIASPAYPIRAEVGSPCQMITNAYACRAKHGSAADQALWLAAIDHMIHGFVECLVNADPDELCPTKGMIFQALNRTKPGDIHDALVRICTAMACRYAQLIATGIKAPQGNQPKPRRV